MTLFFSSFSRCINVVKRKGVAGLQDFSALVCDRVPVWPDELADDTVNLRFEINEDVSSFKVLGIDLPEGQWFDIPCQVLDRAAHEIHVQKNP